MSRLDNVDEQVAAGFGDEWTRFDQSGLSAEARERIFSEYFAIFPWERVSRRSIGADFGCGSGRWAALVAPRVGTLICVDASAQALAVARRNLRELDNCRLLEASVGNLPIDDGTLDFAYSLGVLHHVPDAQSALANCVSKLKPGAPFLIYLYYRFDNRPLWYRGLWAATDVMRRAISRLPYPARYGTSQALAIGVYWPLATVAKCLIAMGFRASNFPLRYYAGKPLYVIRTDALDRFGTRLERRFTRREIERMMGDAGLEDIRFSERAPYWCAVGFRRSGAA